VGPFKTFPENWAQSFDHGAVFGLEQCGEDLGAVEHFPVFYLGPLDVRVIEAKGLTVGAQEFREAGDGALFTGVNVKAVGATGLSGVASVAGVQ
jgi:hypothetical protein